MKKAFLSAAGAVLALAAAVTAIQPEMRGYATGYECYLGSGCAFKATVTQCVACCDANCNHGHLYNGCVDACIGIVPGKAIPIVREAAQMLQAGVVPESEIASVVAVVEAGMRHSDARVRMVSLAIAGETPFVRVHTEQGERQPEEKGRAS